MVLLQKEIEMQYFVLLGSAQLLASSMSQGNGGHCAPSPVLVPIAASPASQGQSMRDASALGAEHPLGKVESPHQ